MPEKTVQKEPGKKPAPSKKPKPQQEVVVQIPLSELHPFPDHPFQVREDASMQETAESVKEYGVLVPALARPREDGGYELIAGHRRKHACELAGLATMPVIVRDIDRDAATIIMVDSNLQRENILPSERAKAYKMKMEAIKRQGARTDLTSPKISAKFRSDDEVGQDAGVSGDTIRNYIALTQLVPELQQMVDEKKIALSPAYQLAALTPKEQGLLLETIDSEQTTPSLSQAQRMKKLSQSGELNEDTMLSIMMEQKKPEKLKIMKADHNSKQFRLEDSLLKYFPEKIEEHKGFVRGLEADMQTLAAHPLPAEGFVGMEIRGDRLTDKENAGAALLDTCKEVKGKDPVQIGSYRGFTMSVAFDSMWKTYTLTLKGQMTHRVELGSDARGNLVRIENALDKMPERLRSVQEQLENLYNQQAAAKAEVGKPFPQEQELAAKTARLIELDMELNLDGKGQPQPEQAIAKSARPSVLDRLKASPVHGAPEKPHKKEMEAR